MDESLPVAEDVRFGKRGMAAKKDAGLPKISGESAMRCCSIAADASSR